MKRRIILHGHLGDAVGRHEWRLDVATPAEALQAIEAQRPGLFARILDDSRQGINYAVIADGESFSNEDIAEYHPLASRQTLEFVPLVGGAGGGDNSWLMIVLGVVLIAASLALGPAGFGASLGITAGSFGASAVYAVGAIGLSLALNGVAALISGTPKTTTFEKAAQESANDTPSYYFGGQVNLTGHGQPVPVGYGRLIVGSRRISMGIWSEKTL